LANRNRKLSSYFCEYVSARGVCFSFLLRYVVPFAVSRHKTSV